MRHKFNFYAVTNGRKVKCYYSVIGFAKAKYKIFIKWESSDAIIALWFSDFIAFEGQNTCTTEEYENCRNTCNQLQKVKLDLKDHKFDKDHMTNEIQILELKLRKIFRVNTQMAQRRCVSEILMPPKHPFFEKYDPDI